MSAVTLNDPVLLTATEVGDLLRTSRKAIYVMADAWDAAGTHADRASPTFPTRCPDRLAAPKVRAIANKRRRTAMSVTSDPIVRAAGKWT